ncbi:hypothetical protein H4R34_004057 [Dimargaris verticillata]|uniref:Uncharacterized protein n=1 Tax=Dimargaris verticillata TaxID=2761393 RepID=A0A9W8E8H6_9FUNG|nr:hypothetical protein H4R34_004057 [Dimargaris verticillata]
MPPKVPPTSPGSSVDNLYTSPISEVRAMSETICIGQCRPQDLIEYRRHNSKTRRYGQVIRVDAKPFKIAVFEFATGKTQTYSWRSALILYLYRPMRLASAPHQLLPRAYLSERSLGGKSGSTWCRFEMFEYLSDRLLFRPSDETVV